MRLFAIARYHQRRASIPLNHARRSDADDAAVPALAVDDHAIGIPQNSVFGEALLDCIYNAALLFLAFAVELVEFEGNFAGAGGILRIEQLDYIRCNVHAAGGVDAWADAEADVEAGDRTARWVELRNLKEGTQPRADGPAKLN